ncbi:MAG: hypothetical protein MZV63_34435 [Marinilabiliales bacterium]|nr:hypothetical protein [Marinilabiliales bacterium]
MRICVYGHLHWEGRWSPSVNTARGGDTIIPAREFGLPRVHSAGHHGRGAGLLLSASGLALRVRRRPHLRGGELSPSTGATGSPWSGSVRRRKDLAAPDHDGQRSKHPGEP